MRMRKARQSRTTSALALSLAAVVAGCGGGRSQTSEVLTTTAAYFHAVDSGRQAKACSYVTSSLRARLERTGTAGAPCGGTLAKLTPPHAGVTSFQLHGDTANLTALGRHGRTAAMMLTKTGGDWKVADIKANR